MIYFPQDGDDLFSRSKSVPANWNCKVSEEYVQGSISAPDETIFRKYHVSKLRSIVDAPPEEPKPSPVEGTKGVDRSGTGRTFQAIITDGTGLINAHVSEDADISSGELFDTDEQVMSIIIRAYCLKSSDELKPTFIFL